MKRQASRYPYARPQKEKTMPARERLRLARLTAASAILLLAVLLKLTAPGFTAAVQKRVDETFSRDINLRQVVSAFGYLAAGEGKSSERWAQVYEAVFAPKDSVGVVAEMASATLPCYSLADIPARAQLTQTVLDYAYETPVEGTLSSAFGLRTSPVLQSEEFHYGLDLAAAEGTAVCAFADGTVRSLGESSSYGKYLIVDHANDSSTLYAHLSRSDVRAGETVTRGQPIAAVGQTGNATGPHLHFELQKEGRYLNPIYYVETA